MSKIKTPEEALETVRFCVSQVDKLMDELSRLKEGEKLLNDIILSVNIHSGKVSNFYGERGEDPNALPKSVLKRIRDYIKYDDSE